jgi:hypothetical protein
MIPFATNTVTISRHDAGPSGAGGMTDPWETPAALSVVHRGVRAVISNAKATGEREGPGWQSIEAIMHTDVLDIRIGDQVLDTHGRMFTVREVVQRDEASMGVDYTRCLLHRLDAEQV